MTHCEAVPFDAVAQFLDPTVPTATVAIQPPPERWDRIGLSPAGSLANLGAILALALLIRLYLIHRE
jgi:hypothetical protein